jgi:hypothetical protein
MCSGFDSDCNFGDDRCRESDRLVYGPFCREDNYEYINTGLYRVTLYGEGDVQAGATDYNITHDYEMMGTQRFTLPGSYTFCWDGLQDGGTGFETIVQPRSAGAYVDHITLEYLGRDCSLPGADNPAAGMGSGEMGVLTVYNLEGGVGVELPDGQEGDPGQGQRLRIYYDGSEPVAMDDSATDAPYILGSDLAQWATGSTGSGLPDIRIVEGGTTDTPTPRDPVVSVTANVMYDDGTPDALRIEAQAYDPIVGEENGDGIDYVHFAISDAGDNVVYERDESNPAYCAFGGDSPCEVSLSDAGVRSGDFRVTATAYSDSGRQASASTSFTLAATERAEPVITLDAAVLYDDGAPSSLRIEAQAYDPNVGSSNGDGIDHVYFTIRNSDGDSVYENDEGSTAYCAFGGDSPCEQSIGPSDFSAGDYEVTATAYTDSGAEASTTTSFTLDWGATPPPPPGDTTPPFFNSVSYPSGNYCFGDTVTVGADVYDESDIASVTLHYLLLNVDPEFPEYGGYPYEAVYVGSGDGPYEASFDVGDLNTANFYFTAVDAAGNEGTSNTITLTGNDCGPVVR